MASSAGRVRARQNSTGSVSGRSSANSSVGSAGSSRTPPGSGVRQKSKPSDVLNPKTIDPFNDGSKNVTAFAAVYNNGGVPCRLIHGSVKHKLAWNTPPDQVPFDPVLVTLAEGLRETVHPYTFVATQGFKEMLESEEAGPKTIPLLPKLQNPIRKALAHSDPKIFESTLAALVQLSAAVGPALNPYLKSFLVSLSSKMMNKQYKEKVTLAMQQFESNGGREVLPIIKSKIPTYSSIFT